MVCKVEEKYNEKGNLDKKDLELIYEIVRRQLKFMIKYNILMIPKTSPFYLEFSVILLKTIEMYLKETY